MRSVDRAFRAAATGSERGDEGESFCWGHGEEVRLESGQLVGGGGGDFDAHGNSFMKSSTSFHNPKTGSVQMNRNNIWDIGLLLAACRRLSQAYFRSFMRAPSASARSR